MIRSATRAVSVSRVLPGLVTHTRKNTPFHPQRHHVGEWLTGMSWCCRVLGKISAVARSSTDGSTRGSTVDPRKAAPGTGTSLTREVTPQACAGKRLVQAAASARASAANRAWAAAGTSSRCPAMDNKLRRRLATQPALARFCCRWTRRLTINCAAIRRCRAQSETKRRSPC